jgi:hypothetical protein
MKAIAIWLPVVVLLTARPTTLAAQQVGDNFTIVVPAGAVTDLKKVLVVTGKPKAPVKVGTCAPGTFQFWDARLVDRDGKSAPVQTEVALIIPGAAGFKDLRAGWHVGSWREGGRCGPGFEAFLVHIIAIDQSGTP